MQLAEIRDLDGPNLFALEPVIKLEVILQDDPGLTQSRSVSLTPDRVIELPEEPIDAIRKVIQEMHRALGLRVPGIKNHKMDLPGHVSLYFPWRWRQTALTIAETAFQTINETQLEVDLEPLRHALAEDRERNDRPTWVRNDERTARTIAVTGTNGKTTTTRLLAHILRSSGLSTGWSSSSGVYINGEMVLDGDYTGHGGARRVLLDPSVEVGVLETARGGVLLRGLGYESSDVGVFLNVSADHIGLHGVTKLETLTRVKSTVVRTTRRDGVVVLNADDDLVMSQAPEVKARIWLLSQDANSPRIRAHAEEGGRYLVRDGDQIRIGTGHGVQQFVSLQDVPITYAGAARHMVENALAASAAALGLGIAEHDVLTGLTTFAPDPEHNAGRLNVFEIDGRTVIVDYAHNESGLLALIEFARARFPDRTSITAVIGTAGDRDDDVFRGLGRIAARHADRILLKQNPGYLRGRNPDGVLELMAEGIREQGAEGKLAGTYPSEYDATFADLEEHRPDDVLVIMCVEDFRRVIDELQRITAEQNRTEA